MSSPRSPALPPDVEAFDRGAAGRAGLRYTLAGSTAGFLLDAILATATWDIEGAEHHSRLVAARRGFVLAFWHGRLVPLGYLHRDCGHTMMISRSRDGEYGSALARHWGQIPARGSSSRGGGLALHEMIELAAAGRSLAFTPDGPRGPRARVKPGAVIAAQRTGLPVLPMSAGASRAWWIVGWDRFLVPKPFAHIRVRYGASFHVGATDDIDAACARLQDELDRLTALADGETPATASPETPGAASPGRSGGA